MTVAYLPLLSNSLANGVEPGHFFNKQSEMRKHLLRSLEEKVLTMFPVETMKRGRVSVHCINCREIFCSCQIPVEGKMIECSGCKE